MRHALVTFLLFISCKSFETSHKQKDQPLTPQEPLHSISPQPVVQDSFVAAAKDTKDAFATYDEEKKKDPPEDIKAEINEASEAMDQIDTNDLAELLGDDQWPDFIDETENQLVTRKEGFGYAFGIGGLSILVLGMYASDRSLKAQEKLDTKAENSNQGSEKVTTYKNFQDESKNLQELIKKLETNDRSIQKKIWGEQLSENSTLKDEELKNEIKSRCLDCDNFSKGRLIENLKAKQKLDYEKFWKSPLGRSHTKYGMYDILGKTSAVAGVLITALAMTFLELTENPDGTPPNNATTRLLAKLESIHQRVMDLHSLTSN